MKHTATSAFSPFHSLQLQREFRSRILLQYSILRTHQDYIYNPASLSDYLSYDPGTGLISA